MTVVLGVVLILSVAAGIVLPFTKKAEWMWIPLVTWVVTLSVLLLAPAH